MPAFFLIVLFTAIGQAETFRCEVTHPLHQRDKYYEVEVDFNNAYLTQLKYSRQSSGGYGVEKEELMNERYLTHWKAPRQDCGTFCYCVTQRVKNDYRFLFNCHGISGMLQYNFETDEGLYYDDFARAGLSNSIAFKNCQSR